MYIVGFVPDGTALLGIVTFPKPMVPVCPVKVKEMAVVVAFWLVMVMLDICEAVMFPLT